MRARDLHETTSAENGGAMSPDALLEQIANSLRNEVGPAVGEPFAKTQAFMAAVVLEKLAGQLRNATSDAETAASEQTQLVVDLLSLLDRHSLLDRADSDSDPDPDSLTGAAGDGVATLAPVVPLRSVIANLEEAADEALSRLLEALYAQRSSLGSDLFAALLGRVRTTLRARLDRQLVYAS